MHQRNMLESVLEQTLFKSRWLLAPFYLGLAISIGILLIKFVQELFHLAQKAFVASEADTILGVLTLVDLSLTGSLLSSSSRVMRTSSPRSTIPGTATGRSGWAPSISRR